MPVAVEAAVPTMAVIGNDVAGFTPSASALAAGGGPTQLAKYLGIRLTTNCPLSLVNSLKGNWLSVRGQVKRGDSVAIVPSQIMCCQTGYYLWMTMLPPPSCVASLPVSSLPI